MFIALALISLGLLLLVLGLGQIKITKNVSGGISVSQNLTVTGASLITNNPTVLAAQPAVLTTRTNNTSGTLTMTNNNHGITTGQRIDLYYSGGQIVNATVGTVSGTSVPISTISAVNGSTTLPIATTAITVGIPVQSVCSCTGNNIQAIILNCPLGNAIFCFASTGADIAAIVVTAGNVYSWNTTDTGANPLASSTPATVWMSHNYTSGSVTNECSQVLTN